MTYSDFFKVYYGKPKSKFLQIFQNPVPPWVGVCCIAVFFIFWYIVCRKVSQPCRFIPSQLNTTVDWRARNTLVSWCHSFLSGAACCLLLFFLPEQLEDPIVHHHPLSYLVLSCSIGYFLYDMLDIIMFKKVCACWEIMVHHIAITILFVWNLFLSSSIAFNIVALSAEVNSFFLHTRKLWHMIGWSTGANSRYFILVYINVLTFVVFRFGSSLYIWHGLYSFYSKLGIAYRIGVFCAQSCISIINLVLFYRIIASDFFYGNRGRFLTRKYSKTELEKSEQNGSVRCNNNKPCNGSNLTRIKEKAM